MPSPVEFSPRSEVITVSELNRSVRQLLEREFPLGWIAGEISNFAAPSSGHWYFTLKDDKAQVRCAMFRHKNQYIDWVPENGMQVEVRALVTLYEPRGDYQLNVEMVRRAGLGALYEAFEKLKQKLEKEGLFEPARKRPLPAFPRQIGIVTSPAAAALRDVLTTLRRRMPSIPVVLYPTPVQGDGAAQKIVDAIRAAGEREECDVLILCRGGGSIEDLWQFNEEIVARAVVESPIPVVCGVGHETDFTIADFVADRRAPTPTGAAEMVSPNRVELLGRLTTLAARHQRSMERQMETRMQHLDHLSRRLVHPGERLKNQAMHLSHLGQRLGASVHRIVDSQGWALQQLRHRLVAASPDPQPLLAQQRDLASRMKHALEKQLDGHMALLKQLQGNLVHLNPQSVLERGYSIVEKQTGGIVRDSRELTVGEELKLTFAHGHAHSSVTSTGDSES